VCPWTRSALRGASAAGALAAALLAAATAAAAPIRISSDPFTSDATGQHATEVEPDSFAAGTTIVTGFQVGRFPEGGAANIGWATSTNSGATWKHGLMPGITTAGGGSASRVTDPAVAYDPKDNVWLVVSVPLGPTPNVRGLRVAVNRSTDGGFTWSKPVTAATATGSSDFDKSWVVCDGTATSPHYGNCYAQWDDFGDAGRMLMSTSTDGGKTWGAVKQTADSATGLAGQPVVQPDGTVVMPYSSSFEDEIDAVTSSDGGASWSARTPVSPKSEFRHHTVAGAMRSGPLPSAEVDKDGRVYVAWEDCRFRPSCAANDIVITSSTDGSSWSAVKRVPLAAVASGEEDFVPGLAVDPSTSGTGAHLALAYHYFPTTQCDFDTCKLHVGLAQSSDGGATWTSPVDLTGAMIPVWLANTSEGYMTGDYISTSFAGGSPHPVFALAHCPLGGTLHEAIYVSNPPFAKGPPNCPPPPKPRTISQLKVKPFRFEAAPHGPSIASSSAGADVSYVSSAAGPTRFNVGHAVKRNGTRAWVRLTGKFTRQDAGGQNKFHFTGHIGGQKLKPGLYRLVVQPRDPDRPTAKVVYAQFRIVKPARSTTAW
jgi:hypothetical protein